MAVRVTNQLSFQSEQSVAIFTLLKTAPAQVTEQRCAPPRSPAPRAAPPRTPAPRAAPPRTPSAHPGAPRPVLTVGAVLLGIEAPVRRALRVIPLAHTARVFSGIGSEDEVTAHSLEDP